MLSQLIAQNNMARQALPYGQLNQFFQQDPSMDDMPMDREPSDDVNHGEDLKLKIQEMKDILEDASKLEKGPDMFGDMVQEFLRLPGLMKNVLDDAKAVSQEDNEPQNDGPESPKKNDKQANKPEKDQKDQHEKEAPGTEEGALLEVDDETPEDKQEQEPEDDVDIPLGDLDFPIAMEEKALEHEFEVDFNSTMGFKPGNVTVHITKDVHKLVDDSDDDEPKDDESGSDDSDSQSSSDSEDEGQLVKSVHESIDIKQDLIPTKKHHFYDDDSSDDEPASAEVIKIAPHNATEGVDGFVAAKSADDAHAEHNAANEVAHINPEDSDDEANILHNEDDSDDETAQAEHHGVPEPATGHDNTPETAMLEMDEPDQLLVEYVPYPNNMHISGPPPATPASYFNWLY